MLPVLLLLFIAVPIVELAVIIQVGQWIGLWPTLALLVADSVLGTMLMRSQSRLAWRRFNEALATGRPPAREVIDGALVIFGGAFLLTPGFVTDIFGILLLLPPSRAVLRGLLVRRLAKGMVVRFGPLGRPPTGPVGGRSRGPFGEGAGPADVDSTATEVDPRRLHDGGT
jgi:UPF0716 protein FxsA